MVSTESKCGNYIVFFPFRSERHQMVATSCLKLLRQD